MKKMRMTIVHEEVFLAWEGDLDWSFLDDGGDDGRPFEEKVMEHINSHDEIKSQIAGIMDDVSHGDYNRGFDVSGGLSIKVEVLDGDD